MAKLTTNSDSIPGFDAVAESRKWRETTSRLLHSMSREERLAYLNRARECYLVERNAESSVIREEPPAK
jgi:hypothetical protein